MYFADADQATNVVSGAWFHARSHLTYSVLLGAFALKMVVGPLLVTNVRAAA